MAYAKNPPFKAWRIKVKADGVLMYIVSSTEPFERSDGSIAYTEVPGYGEHIARIDWPTAGPISWWPLDPDSAPQRTPSAPSKAKKAKKSKPAEPAERVVPENVMERIRAKAAEEWRTDEKARAVRVKGLIHLYWQGIDRAN